MTGAKINYSSDAGSLTMIILEHKDLVKAFRTIFIMEQNRIDNIKLEEKSLHKAQELIDKEVVKK